MDKKQTCTPYINQIDLSRKKKKKKERNSSCLLHFPLPTSTLGWLMSDRVTGYASLTLSKSPVRLRLLSFLSLSLSLPYFNSLLLSLSTWLYPFLSGSHYGLLISSLLSCLPPLGWSTGLDLIPSRQCGEAPKVV